MILQLWLLGGDIVSMFPKFLIHFSIGLPYYHASSSFQVSLMGHFFPLIIYLFFLENNHGLVMEDGQDC